MGLKPANVISRFAAREIESNCTVIMKTVPLGLTIQYVRELKIVLNRWHNLSSLFMLDFLWRQEAIIINH